MSDPTPRPSVGTPKRSRLRRLRRWLFAPAVIAGLAVALQLTTPSGSGGHATTAGSSFIPGGGTAPAFTLSDLEHTSARLTLAAFRGRPVIVNFWASWCTPCRKEMPLIEATYRHLSSRIAFVGIDSNDTRSAAVAFAHEVGVSYPLAYDPGGSVASGYGLLGLPTTVFVDANGRIVGRELGQLDPAGLQLALQKLGVAAAKP